MLTTGLVTQGVNITASGGDSCLFVSLVDLRADNIVIALRWPIIDIVRHAGYHH